MILLRRPPQAGWLNDSGDLLSFWIKMFLLDTRRYLFGDLKLFGCVGEYAGTIFYGRS